jgi:hypothetical protein
MLNFCEIQHPKGNRQRPESRPQARNFPYGISLVLSLCLLAQRKNGNDFLT